MLVLRFVGAICRVVEYATILGADALAPSSKRRDTLPPQALPRPQARSLRWHPLKSPPKSESRLWRLFDAVAENEGAPPEPSTWLDTLEIYCQNRILLSHPVLTQGAISGARDGRPKSDLFVPAGLMMFCNCPAV